jgi:hypothetical protein
MKSKSSRSQSKDAFKLLFVDHENHSVKRSRIQSLASILFWIAVNVCLRVSRIASKDLLCQELAFQPNCHFRTSSVNYDLSIRIVFLTTIVLFRGNDMATPEHKYPVFE